MTFYDLLGVPPTASHAELRRAFVHLARQAHPDVHATADAATRRAAEQRMRELNEAWAVLGDGERRRRYDAQLAAGRPASAAAPRRPGAGGAPKAGAASAAGAGATGRNAASHAAAGSSAADWRRYASPGPALHRSAAARLIAIVPPALLALAALFLGAGALFRATTVIGLAGATAVVAALAFLAAPILTMKEGRRTRRRPDRRSVHHVSGRAHRG